MRRRGDETRHPLNRSRGRTVRLWLGFASLGVALVTGVAAIPATGGVADTTTFGIDRSAYVPNPSTAPDQYWADAEGEGGHYGPDPVDLHVAASGNQVTYYGLIRVELDAIPANATVQSLVVSFKPDIGTGARSGDTVNASANDIIDAFPLKTDIPADFSGCQPPPQPTATNPDPGAPPCTPPAYDTTATTSAVAKAGANPSSDAWTVDVAPLLPYWQKAGNTGLALVPNPPASNPDPNNPNTNQSWAIAFNRDSFAVTATYTVPSSGQQFIITTPSKPVIGSAGGSSGGGGFTNLPTTAATPAPAVTPHPSASALPSAVPPVANTGGPTPGAGVPPWLLILCVSGAAAIALLAQPLSQALSTAGGVRAGLVRELSLHPRMFSVAAVLVVWSSVWGVYSGVTAPRLGSNSQASVRTGPGANVPSYGSPDQTAQPGATATPGTTGGGGGGGNFGGGGSATSGASAFGTVTGFNPPAATLFGPNDDSTGITNTTIQLCGHSALTFAKAFNIGPQDLNVFWDEVNDPATDPYQHTAGQGGIWNRRVVIPGTSPSDATSSDSTSFNNPNNWGVQVNDDGYQQSQAVTAAQTCNDQQGGDFALLSGIGFDQIPAVRVWAEQNHMLYIHQVVANSNAYRYSFTMMPSVEQIGTNFGQYYLAHQRNMKVGIIYRNSSNWEPGHQAFDNVLKQAGLGGNIVDEEPVNNNQGDYTEAINKMHLAQADVVFVWENALYAEQIIQQANNQGWDPSAWDLFPFNLTLYTLEQAKVPDTDLQNMVGVYNLPAYTAGSGVNCQQPPQGSGVTRNDADYQANLKEIEEFEAAYNKWDKTADLCGDGGDLLFTTYEYSKQIAELIDQCGPDCTRNKLAGLMLNGYHSQVGANCPVDFRGGDGHHGDLYDDVYATKPENNGRGWINTSLCQKNIS